MNRNITFFSALGAAVATAALATPIVLAQATAPAASAPAAAAAPVTPQAIDAKIAIISFEQAVFATNEGQKAAQDVATKFQPQKTKIDAAATEVDSLKKQLQAGTTLSDEARASLIKSIDTKEKQANRDAEDANTAYQQELQESFGRVAQKFNPVVQAYVQQNGFTILLDVSNQQSSPVMWIDQRTDITRAVIDIYNTKSGVAAPPPTAPSAGRPTAPRSTTPRPATTPKK